MAKISFEDLRRIPATRPIINIGAGLDIPTALLSKGKEGENIINGGLSMVTGVVGDGNLFKSTIMHYMVLQAADKVQVASPRIFTYDTEMNMHMDRLLSLASRLPNLDIADLEELWIVTDKTQHLGDEWFTIMKDYMKSKKKEVETPFVNRRGEVIKIKTPDFVEIDSLTDFETSTQLDMYDKSELGDSGGNMIFARAGLVKTRFMLELINLAYANSMYTIFSAHMGEKMEMNARPGMRPKKKMQYMEAESKIKGVSDRVYYSPSIVWRPKKAVNLKKTDVLAPEYPLTPEEDGNGDYTELNLVSLVAVRSKSGRSGYSIDLVVSQDEGVLPDLTNFHFIKTNKRYSLEGNNIRYHSIFYPEVTITRPTVRKLLNEDPKLCRAIELGAQLLQLHIFKPELAKTGLLCSPEELYNDIKKLGYDWNELLDTRGYWTLDQYEHKTPFLSIIDLLYMRKGQYEPFWKK